MKLDFWNRKIYEIIARTAFINPALKKANVESAESELHSSRKAI